MLDEEENDNDQQDSIDEVVESLELRQNYTKNNNTRGKLSTFAPHDNTN